MEEQLNAGIHTKSGKSLMNAFLRARTAFGFEYLISFRAAHSDADRDIMGIEGLLFQNQLNRGQKIVSKFQSWRNKWTWFLKFSHKLEELVDGKLEMAPNQMFQQLTDKTKKKTPSILWSGRRACASPLNNSAVLLSVRFMSTFRSLNNKEWDQQSSHKINFQY